MSAVLRVEDLEVSFGGHRVLHGVDFEVLPGRTLGLVGESGSGKSTIAKAVVGLVQPSAGRIVLAGQDVTQGRRSVQTLRTVQMIPQDPYASLDPRQTIGDTLAEAIDPRRGRFSRHRERVLELLDQVALPAAAAGRYPHEFSGGQRQRVAVARAVAVRPALIIADEVTSALDTSVQAEVLGVLRELKDELDLTMLFISHDLAVVRQVCDDVAVLRDGELVENASRQQLFDDPQHPYTRLLLGSVL